LAAGCTRIAETIEAIVTALTEAKLATPDNEAHS
jgi:hypothetical protein